MATAPESYISERDYLLSERQSETKAEYVDGQVLAMAGASERHNRLLSNLIMLVGPQLRGGGCRIYPSDLKIKVANRYFYPDASIVCGKAVFTDDMNDVVLNPTVLFEILSPSSAAYDRGVKFLSYQGIESLREYVLISQDEEIVETYRRHLESSWLYSRAEAELHLDSVGVKVRVCDLYED